RGTEAERRSRPRPPSGVVVNRKSVISPTSRARCLRLALQDPGGLSLLPTAVSPDSTWPLARRYDAAAKGSCRQPVAAGACSLGRRSGVYVWHPSFRIPRPPLSGPACRRLAKRPRLDRPAHEYEGGFQTGDKFLFLLRGTLIAAP